MPYVRKTPEQLRGVKITGGVSRNRMNGWWYYIAHIKIGKDKRRKTFSIHKLGEKGAKLAASFQRLAWLIELGAWNPNDGDPLAVIDYSDFFKGNDEYEHSKVVN